MNNVYNDGQIHGWNGGDCPVHPETVVEVWFRAGACGEKQSHIYCWSCSGGNSDIIAFRVVKPYVEPARPAASKVIWVNEYEDGPSAYTLEEKARYFASTKATRIAVKYVEVIADAKEVQE